MRQVHQHCTVAGCGLRHKSRGYCATHYAQWLRGRNPDQPIKRRDSTPPEFCSVDGCGHPVKSKGLCSMHYARHLRHGFVKNPDRTKPFKICSVDGCDSRTVCKGMCNLHYTHARNVTQYGITADEYQRVLAAQGGGCAICGGQERMLDPRSKKPRMMSVDHDHKTGKVRGILCSHHNRGLGLFDDNADLLLKAAAYLQHHSSS